MAFVGILRNYGFGEGWFTTFVNAWVVMMPVAYFAAFIIIPKAKKLSEKVALQTLVMINLLLNV